MSKPKLAEKDFQTAARKLNCEVAAIKSVAEVESVKGGFDGQDRVIIRFERHRFKKYTDGIYNRTHPDISASYRKGQPGSRAYFNKAFALDPTAAMLSTSFGKFQIMGDEHRRCGFTNVHAFVDAMNSGEPAHLEAFVNFVIDKKLKVHIQNKDWARFAHGLQRRKLQRQ